MRIGQKIKQARLLRGLTQKELGMMVGFDEKTADIRIAQYEASARTPKTDMREMLCRALEISPRYFQNQDIYTAEGIMSFLFELDGVYGLDLTPCKGGTKAGVNIHVDCNSLDGFLIDWMERKQALSDGAIKTNNYTEWILTWPETDG